MIGGLAYPGGTAEWGLLWTQNVLLVFVQFTTAAALFTQDARYLPFPRWGRLGLDRSTLVTVHAATGAVVVAANAVFAALWLSGQGLDGAMATPVLTVPSLVLTLGLLVMGATGVALYAHARPGTRLPAWQFGYAFSRKLHRATFVAVVATLGVHLFLTLRVSAAWTAWFEGGSAWGYLVLGVAAVWGAMAGLVLPMVVEWLTGDVFSGWDRDDGTAFAAVGGAVGVAVAVATTVDLAALAVAAVALIAAAGVVALLARHDPRR